MKKPERIERIKKAIKDNEEIDIDRLKGAMFTLLDELPPEDLIQMRSKIDDELKALDMERRHYETKE